MTYEALPTLHPERLARHGFGAMRAEPLEQLYRSDPDSPYKELEKVNELLLRMKEERTGGADDHDRISTFYSVRGAFYSDARLRNLLQMVPKGNFAHLHFNAYLPTDGISSVYTRALEDPVVCGADTTAFKELLETARQPYGDLMDFPGGELGGRADK